MIDQTLKAPAEKLARAIQDAIDTFMFETGHDVVIRAFRERCQVSETVAVSNGTHIQVKPVRVKWHE